MPYTLTCADSGQDCPAQFTTATSDELMQVVTVHAGISHPEMKLDDETVAAVKGLVKQS